MKNWLVSLNLWESDRYMRQCMVALVIAPTPDDAASKLAKMCAAQGLMWHRAEVGVCIEKPLNQKCVILNFSPDE